MNTVWDNIYKDYEQGGPGQSNIEAPLRPEFIKFVKESDFLTKSAFDIGFGTGKYLKFLAGLGFTIAGIDNSETALKMASELVGEKSDLKMADMFSYEIPVNKYDFIYSLATIHHGTKDNVKILINKIYNSLIDRGKIFIDLPNEESHNLWRTFKTAEEISPGTFRPIDGPEKGLIHSVFNNLEVKELFKPFQDVVIFKSARQRWLITASKKLKL